MSKSLMKILKFALKHWLSMLLTVVGMGIGGRLLLLYRAYLKDWFLSVRYVEMQCWAWILCVVIVVVVSATIPIVVYKCRLQKGQTISDVNDIQICLGKWWINWKSNTSPTYNKADSNLATKFISGFYVIECSKVDDQIKLKKDSTIKYLPEIIEKDREYKITQQGQHILKLAKEISISPGDQKFAQMMSEGLEKGNA